MPRQRMAGNRLTDYMNRYSGPITTNTSRTVNDSNRHSRTHSDKNRFSAEQANKVTQTPVQSPKFEFGKIEGNNNTQSVGDITQNVDYTDNSRYYGDDVRNFTYHGGDGESKLYDSPVSMATMGGYYDVDDSPKATSQFLDKYINENRINQEQNDKAYKKSGTFDYDSDKSRAFDVQQYYDNMTQSVQQSYDNAKLETNKLFGDLEGYYDRAPEFVMPEPPRPPQSIEDIIGEIEDL